MRPDFLSVLAKEAAYDSVEPYLRSTDKELRSVLAQESDDEQVLEHLLTDHDPEIVKRAARRLTPQQAVAFLRDPDATITSDLRRQLATLVVRSTEVSLEDATYALELVPDQLTAFYVTHAPTMPVPETLGMFPSWARASRYTDVSKSPLLQYVKYLSPEQKSDFASALVTHPEPKALEAAAWLPQTQEVRQLLIDEHALNPERNVERRLTVAVALTLTSPEFNPYAPDLSLVHETLKLSDASSVKYVEALLTTLGDPPAQQELFPQSISAELKAALVLTDPTSALDDCFGEIAKVPWICRMILIARFERFRPWAQAAIRISGGLPKDPFSLAVWLDDQTSSSFDLSESWRYLNAKYGSRVHHSAAADLGHMDIDWTDDRVSQLPAQVLLVHSKVSTLGASWLLKRLSTPIQLELASSLVDGNYTLSELVEIVLAVEAT